MTGDPVYFYAVDGPFGAFSNFARLGIALDGGWWLTSEHYFQAQKFDDPDYRERIRTASSPRQAAGLGRSRAAPLRADWEERKIDVMRRAVCATFRVHPALREMLLSTGDRPIVEAAPGDAFWGTGPEGTGLNWLGRVLVEVRDAIRAEAATA